MDFKLLFPNFGDFHFGVALLESWVWLVELFRAVLGGPSVQTISCIVNGLALHNANLLLAFAVLKSVLLAGLLALSLIVVLSDIVVDGSMPDVWEASFVGRTR